MAATATHSYGLDQLELRALSMPSTLLFLLGVEYDIFLCVTRVGGRTPFTVRFPPVAPQYRRLLALCAERFGLRCDDSTTAEGGGSCVKGTAKVPLLRYADFLPGQLHMDEILSALNVQGARQALPVAGEENVFAATFISYEAFSSDDALNESTGLGHYLQLEYGLSLATQGHLIEFTVSDPHVSSADAVASFQLFCGWTKFDLRFEDDRLKRKGVLVMPSVQDAIDIFEKYEDEDSDDDEDSLPFALRPVGPLTAVPFVEDSQLRKLRSHHWNLVVKFWQSFPRTKNCIVVSNLYEKAQLDEIVKIFDGLRISASALVADSSPFQRRRAFITFADSDAAREALGFDGKNTHGKALRMQVSPPYIDDTRRGAPVRSRSCSPSPQMSPMPMLPPPPEMILPEPAKKIETTPKTTFGMNAEAKEFIPKFLAAGTGGASPSLPPAGPPPPYVPSPQVPLPPPPPPLSQAPPGYSASPQQAFAQRSPVQGYQLPPYSLPPPYLRTPPQPPGSMFNHGSFGSAPSHTGHFHAPPGSAGLPPPPPPPPAQ